MAPAGLATVEEAKRSGTWTALDEVEKLVIPADLQAAFEENETASNHWNNFPPSSKRGILEWIFNAKKPETRQKRIDETVAMAAQGLAGQSLSATKKQR